VRLEIYYAGDAPADGDAGGLSVYSAGTLVAEGFHQLASLGLDRAPWTDARLAGMVDFPAFRVAPGSRRGVILDEAAGAFAGALASVEPVLSGLLETYERRREAELDRHLIRDLQRAFRNFYRHRPRYAMLPVRAGQDAGAGADEASEPGAGTGGEAGDAGEREPDAGSTESPRDLLPPGPLAAVRLIPAQVRVLCGARKTVRAVGLDAGGRPVEAPVEYAWRLEGPVGSLEPVDGATDRVTILGTDAPARGSIEVVARAGEAEALASTDVEVLEELPGGRPGEGIPEPELVDQPGAAWRSRMVDGRWQVNAGHRDYRAIAERPALKLRYLAMLFAKEVVLRSVQDPRLERPLEQMVEVNAYADRNLNSRRARRRPRRETEPS